MKYIGAHVSAGAGVENAPQNAADIGAKAFAFFTKNQRQWQAGPLTQNNLKLFRQRLREHNFNPAMVLPHDSYLINLGSPEDDKLKKSRAAFLDEMKRCEQLGLTMLNFHPGSHLNLVTEEQCLDIIAASINEVLAQSSGVTAVIENTAGQGSNLGYKFEHLAHIIALIHDQTRIGVCLDTCHTFSAGYDIRSAAGYTQTFKEFDDVVGFKFLKALHINDSQKALGSRVDRHESLGAGTLGIEFFQRLMQDKRFDEMPLILETPKDERWPEEIKQLYSFAASK